jgi:hypothetical protein
MGAGLRASAKALEVPPGPTVGAPVPDPTDEGGQARVAMIRLVRHRRTKGAGTDRPSLRSRDTCSLLYPKFSRCYRGRLLNRSSHPCTQHN